MAGGRREIGPDAAARGGDHRHPARQRLDDDEPVGLASRRQQECIDLIEEGVLCRAVKWVAIAEPPVALGLRLADRVGPSEAVQHGGFFMLSRRGFCSERAVGSRRHSSRICVIRALKRAASARHPERGASLGSSAR